MVRWKELTHVDDDLIIEGLHVCSNYRLIDQSAHCDHHYPHVDESRHEDSVQVGEMNMDHTQVGNHVMVFVMDNPPIGSAVSGVLANTLDVMLMDTDENDVGQGRVDICHCREAFD